MKKRVIMVHGWGGSPFGGWKPWFKLELEKRGFEVKIPQMPHAENPKMNEWLVTLSAEVGKPDENTILVGHSLGAVAVPRYIESLKGKETVGGAVLVAGFSDDLGIPELENFFPLPLDFAKIRAHCKKFVAIHSDDDYYVNLKYGYEFERELGAKLVIMPHHKHFSSADGFTELPIVLQSVLEIAGVKH